MYSFNKNTWLSTVILLLTITNIEAQSNPVLPKLVVNILIDQLRSDYLEAFMPLYGEDGFNFLLKEGKVYTQVSYESKELDRAASVAFLQTGTPAINNGIIATKWLDRNTLHPLYAVEDTHYKGINCTKGSSPKYLRTTSVSDELKLATAGKSLVFALAPYREMAVLSAGHLADGAFWIDDETGEWASSTYYTAFPAWLNVAGNTNSAKTLGLQTWEPYNELVGNFNYFLSGGLSKSFKHKFQGDNQYENFKTSALVNTSVLNVAEACIRNTLIGLDAIPDYLSLTLYAGTYKGESVNKYPLEMQDTYVRLDHSLGKFIQYLKQKIGLQNLLITLTSTGVSDDIPDSFTGLSLKLPSGSFDIEKAKNLLNVYFTALWGTGQYVEATYGKSFYFNHKLIEQKGLNLEEVLNKAKTFLLQLSGVKEVYTSFELLSGAWSPTLQSYRNAFVPQHSGDIIINIAPGWTMWNNQTGKKQTFRESYIPFPLIFLGNNFIAQKNETPITIDRVAPTISKALRIRAPNGCTAFPLP